MNLKKACERDRKIEKKKTGYIGYNNADSSMRRKQKDNEEKIKKEREEKEKQLETER